jgi:hypothetical protein
MSLLRAFVPNLSLFINIVFMQLMNVVITLCFCDGWWCDIARRQVSLSGSSVYWMSYESSAKSLVAENSTEWGHQIKFQETKVLAKTSGYTDQLVKETTEIILHPSNVNREEGLKRYQSMETQHQIIRALHCTWMRKKKLQRQAQEEHAKRKTA